jgi:hypothetical protein
MARRLIALLAQILNAVALLVIVCAGAVGGALGLMAITSRLGITPNPGLTMVGFGLGGLAGFFMWAVPQLPPRSKANRLKGPQAG